MSAARRRVPHAGGRYILVAGRRWRATDPMIPPERAAELRSALMAWRREVKAVRGTDAERKQRWETAVPLPAQAG